MNNDRRSPGTRVPGVLAVVFSIVISPAPLRAQRVLRAEHALPAHRERAPVAIRTTLDGAKAPNAFAAGDSVEVEYFRRGDWIPARVTDVVNDGYAYAVDLVPYDDGRIVNAQIHYSRVREHARLSASAPTPLLAPSALASLPRVAAIPAAERFSVIAVAVRAPLDCAAPSDCDAATFPVLQQGTNDAPPIAPTPRADAAPPGPSVIPPAPIPLASSPLALARPPRP